jgi:flagellar P-ring protein precursor FlgI
MNGRNSEFRFQTLLLALVILSWFFIGNATGATRIKDITRIDGLQSKQLIGYGLVVGLNGSGDGKRAAFTVQSLVNMLERLGVNVDPEEIKAENVAAVITTAELEPFTKPGSKVDVTVSSLGDASSLEGGNLLMTPLKGVDGVVYVIAQGSISIGGFNVDAGAGNKIRENHPNVGIAVSGGLVQIGHTPSFVNSGTFQLAMLNKDFYTADSIVKKINASFGQATAFGLDAGNILVNIPLEKKRDPVGFIAELEILPVDMDVAAKVIINERTGTIVIGQGVEVGEAAIAHGTLTVEIKADYNVSQSEPFSGGTTVIVPKIRAYVQNREARIFAVKESSSVGTIAEALNDIGVTPRDIIAIFQSLKRAGALRAELVII